jgi:hypothetical protein
MEVNKYEELKIGFDNPAIIFSLGGVWVIKIEKKDNKHTISFNTEDLPDLIPETLAIAVCQILTQSSWLDDIIRIEAKKIVDRQFKIITGEEN